MVRRKIFFWSPNYAPELIGIPPLVTDAAEWLAQRGHEVRVVAPVPNYPSRVIEPNYRRTLWRTESLRGVSITRTAVRVRPRESFVDKAIYEGTYLASSVVHALRREAWADVVVVVVPTLLTACVGVTVARALRRPVVVWVQDLVLHAASSVRDQSSHHRAALSLVSRLERLALRPADRFIVCNPIFRTYYEARGVPSERIETIFNWVHLDELTPLEQAPGGRVRALYAGNLGYTQGFETLIAAANRLTTEVDIEIVGSGNAESDVREWASVMSNVEVAPPVSKEGYAALLASADIQLVLQRRVSADANLPSKIANYLASGRPIIASMDEASTAAVVLRESGGAIVVAPENPAALARAIDSLARDAALRAELGARGRAYAYQRFDRGSALERFELALLGGLAP